MVVCILIPRFELSTAVGARKDLLRESRRARARARPRAGRGRGLGRGARRSASTPGCGSARRSRAARRCGSSRPIPTRAAAPGSPCSPRSRRSAPRSSLRARARPTSRPTGSAGCYGGNVEGVLARTRRAVAMPARLGAAPEPLLRLRGGEPRTSRARREVVPAGAERAFLAPLPVTLLRSRPEAVARGRAEDLCTVLERLGVRTLGELAALRPARSRTASAGPGMLARELARGRDTSLRPRPLSRGARRAARAPRGGLRAAARADPGALDRPAARAPRAARPVAAKASARRPLRGAGDLAPGGHDARGDGRQASACASRSRRGSPSCRRRSTSSASPWSAFGPAASRPAELPAARRARAAKAPRRGAAPDARGRRPGVAPARARDRSRLAHPRAAHRPDPVSRMTARVYRPRPVNVRVDADGAPASSAARRSRRVREEWLVEDRWWTGAPAAPPLPRARHLPTAPTASSSAISRAAAGSLSAGPDATTAHGCDRLRRAARALRLLVPGRRLDARGAPRGRGRARLSGARAHRPRRPLGRDGVRAGRAAGSASRRSRARR